MAKAETTTKTEEKRATTKKASTKKEATPKTDETQVALENAMKIIAEMQAEMAELKKEKESTIVVENRGEKRRKVKCISLAHHPVNVSTMPDLGGKIFQFRNYGQIIQINYDDILEVIASYPNTMSSGLIYICDNDIIEDNGLSEAYKRIYDKETMDMLVYLRNESDADLILGMSDDLRESTIVEVVRLYRNGEKMDGGALTTLRENGIDIAELAKEPSI